MATQTTRTTRTLGRGSDVGGDGAHRQSAPQADSTKFISVYFC